MNKRKWVKRAIKYGPIVYAAIKKYRNHKQSKDKNQINPRSYN